MGRTSALPHTATSLAGAPHPILWFSKPECSLRTRWGPGQGPGSAREESWRGISQEPLPGAPFLWRQSLGDQPSVLPVGAEECGREGRGQSREGEKVHEARSKRRWKQVGIWAHVV